MPVDATVIVPVHNPGVHFQPCVESLLAQTMPPDRLELLFVDDGSTDGTETLLDQLADKHPNVNVIHQEASGWSGKPRNTGIDAAHGEYVYFVDHDDAVPADALEALVATARRTEADIVVGKIVGVGRGAPFALFMENNDDATLDNSLIITGLTPHKLFRRTFLNEHGIRFPEGKRRLEDHPFVVASYFAARRIAVLSDRVCYLHLKREGNAAATPIDPVGYYDNVRDSIDIVEANTKPGPERNVLVQRFLEGECLRRLTEPKIFKWEPDYLASLVTEVRRLAEERFPNELVAATPPLIRARTRAILADDPDAVLDIAQRARSVQAHVELESLTETPDGYTIAWSSWLRHDDGAPVTLQPSGDGWRVDERLVPPTVDVGTDDAQVLMKQTWAPVMVRHAQTQVRWFAPTDTTVHLEATTPVHGTAARHLVVRGTSTLVPSRLAGGRPLGQGRWDVLIRLSSLGLDRWAMVGPGRPATVTAPKRRPLAGTASDVVNPRFDRPTGGLFLKVRPAD